MAGLGGGGESPVDPGGPGSQRSLSFPNVLEIPTVRDIWHQLSAADGSEPPGICLSRSYHQEANLDPIVAFSHRPSMVRNCRLV